MCRSESNQALLQHSSTVTGSHSSPRQDSALLVGAGETGKKARSSHSVILRSGVLRGSFLVGPGAGRGSAVMRARTQPWEAAAGRVHRQCLLCPKYSHLKPHTPPSARTTETLNLPSGSFLSRAREHLDQIYPE